MRAAGVEVLLADVRVALAELAPSAGDPTFETVWEMLLTATNLAGSRLLEAAHGEEWYAAEEVRRYLTAHLERVSRVASGSPLQAPLLASRGLRATVRYLEATESTDELLVFLADVPGLADAFSDYLVRTSGRGARPVVDVLDLAVRAGALFRDCLARAVPSMPHIANN